MRYKERLQAFARLELHSLELVGPPRIGWRAAWPFRLIATYQHCCASNQKTYPEPAKQHQCGNQQRPCHSPTPFRRRIERPPGVGQDENKEERGSGGPHGAAYAASGGRSTVSLGCGDWPCGAGPPLTGSSSNKSGRS